MSKQNLERAERKSVGDRVYGKYMGRRDSIRNNTALDATWRGIILVLGITIVSIGLLLLIFPGPGWAVIIVGLIVLATEYAWAKRILNPVQEFSSRLARLVMSQEYRAKRSNVILLSTMVVVTLAYAYWARYGATMQGFESILAPIEDLFNIEL